MQVCQSMVAELRGGWHLLKCCASQDMEKPFLSQHAMHFFLQVIAYECVQAQAALPERQAQLARPEPSARMCARPGSHPF